MCDELFIIYCRCLVPDSSLYLLLKKSYKTHFLESIAGGDIFFYLNSVLSATNTQIYLHPLL